MKSLYEEMNFKERENMKREIFEIVAKEKAQLSKEIERLNVAIEKERERAKQMELDKVRLEEKTANSLDNELILRMKEMETQFMREKEELFQRISRISEEKSKMGEDFQRYKIEILEKEKKDMEVKQQNTVAKQRGNNGEDILYDILHRSFASLNCTIENTSGVSHKGDFHLKFEKFTVLVDCKNYIDSKNVNVESRKQIKHDLDQNRHIKIAWLISLNKPISKYGGLSWQFDIEDGICCFYINELLLHSNPEDTLKMVWKASCILYNILDTNCETGELSRLKKYELRVKQIYEKLNNLSKQRHSILMQSLENVNQLKNNFIETDKIDIELVRQDILSIHELHTDTIREWWSSKVMEKVGHKVKTDNLYALFVEEEDHRCIDKEVFREILCTFVKEDEITRGKQSKTQYTFTNYALKVI